MLLAEEHFRRKAKRERALAGKNDKRGRDLQRPDLESATRLVAGRSRAAKSIPTEMTYHTVLSGTPTGWCHRVVRCHRVVPCTRERFSAVTS